MRRLAAIQQDSGRGLAVDRHELMRLLAGDGAAAKAALAALADGADFFVSEASPRLSDGHAGIFAIRHQCMQRKGAEVPGWERAVALLRKRAQFIRIWQVETLDRSWIYTFFLTEDGGDLIACAGVRRPDGAPPQ
ncbi:hypothetical protein AB0M92_09255 [Streptomyces sp. NPDC051582]|uniref:hypothetical protein n=1 Tax=Streptomyces sp. NPDC051582 TaxID=3155167 RepID=UPI003448142C